MRKVPYKHVPIYPTLQDKVGVTKTSYSYCATPEEADNFQA